MMISVNSVHRLAACCVVLVCFAHHAQAQADPTAMRRRALTFFGMGSGVYTDLTSAQSTSYAHGGHNIGITAGADLGIVAFNRYSLAAEVRGTYPIISGNIVGMKSISGGARISREPLGSMSFGGRFRPYADVLFGRGAMQYQNGGYIVDNFLYKQTASWTYGAGAGAEYDLIGPFSAKAEVQFQHWSTPVLPSGSVLPLQINAGVAYRFGAGKGPR